MAYSFKLSGASAGVIKTFFSSPKHIRGLGLFLLGMCTYFYFFFYPLFVVLSLILVAKSSHNKDTEQTTIYLKALGWATAALLVLSALLLCVYIGRGGY